MNEQATLQSIARQGDRVFNEIDVLKGQLTTLKGMFMQLEARINGLVVEMREWRPSRSGDDEPQREHQRCSK